MQHENNTVTKKLYVLVPEIKIYFIIQILIS